MKNPIVIDSTVLLAFCDPDNPQHQAAAATITGYIGAGRWLVVPASALSEVLVGAYRASSHAVRTIEGLIVDLVHLVREIDRKIAHAAASYRAEHPELGLAAALVFGTAKVTAAGQILTTEPTWTTIDPRVRVLT
jgi:predicted nucleic acid-binding protein